MTGTTPETASFREFADIVPCRPSWVTALRKAGRLVLTDDGKSVRVRESLKRIEETRDPSKAAVAERHAANRAASEADSQDPADGADVPAEPQSSEYQKSRAEREKWTAMSARLGYERDSAKLLDAAEVESAAADAVTVFRKAFETMPTTLAAQAVGKTETQIRELIEEARDHALEELARSFNSLAKAGVA